MPQIKALFTIMLVHAWYEESTPGCRSFNNIQRSSPIAFKHVSLWCLLCDPHRTTNQSNLGVRLRRGTK